MHSNKNTKSSFKDLTTGVTQGSILGAVLFSLYMMIWYADDTMIFVKGSDYSEATAQLTKVMVNVSTRVNNSHLQLNTSQNVVFFLAKQRNKITEPDVFISRQKSKL